MDTGAIFSEDNKYRYVLWRIWSVQKPLLMYIGLNPSTANANKNDKTISNLITITSKNGYGGFYMLNLFGLISTQPEALTVDLKAAIGKNDYYLREYGNRVNKIVYCWGNFKEANERALQVVAILSQYTDRACLGKNKNGTPKHPCRLPHKTQIVNF